jgi:hypothetical protein
MCSGARVIAGIAWRQIQATVMTARRHLKRSSMEGESIRAEKSARAYEVAASLGREE